MNSFQSIRFSTQDSDFEGRFAARLHWSADTDAAIEQRVADILADVQKRGDAAVPRLMSFESAPAVLPAWIAARRAANRHL